MERADLVDPFDPAWWPEPVPYEALYLGRKQEHYTIVDSVLVDEIKSMGSWSLADCRGKLYARKTVNRKNGGQTTLYLHRFIAVNFMEEADDVRKYLVDHKNGNGLDNRRDNLSWATPQLNRLNQWGMWWHQKSFMEQLEAGEWQRLEAMNPLPGGPSDRKKPGGGCR